MAYRCRRCQTKMKGPGSGTCSDCEAGKPPKLKPEAKPAVVVPKRKHVRTKPIEEPKLAEEPKEEPKPRSRWRFRK